MLISELNGRVDVIRLARWQMLAAFAMTAMATTVMGTWDTIERADLVMAIHRLREFRQRLDQRLPWLSGGARDLPLRQQTMRDTIAWSYDLLTPEEQTLFRQLSVFVGGFTLESAEAVCNPDGALDVFAGVETLLRNSLLRQVDSPDDEPRFDMLLTIRDYALEKLAEAGELDAQRAAHAQPITEPAYDEVTRQLLVHQNLLTARFLQTPFQEQRHGRYLVPVPNDALARCWGSDG